MTDRLDQSAENFDHWPALDTRYKPLYNRVIELVKDEVDHISGPLVPVIEVGFGTGVISCEILKADPRIILSGMDPSEKMYTIAHRRFSDLGQAKRVSLTLGTAEEVLPELARSPLIVSVSTVHNVEPENRLDVCRKMYDRLTPGGLLILADKIAVNDCTLYLRMFDDWLIAIEGFKRSDDLESYAYWRDKELTDHLRRICQFELERLLKEAGFSGVNDVTIDQRFGMYLVVTARKSS